MKNRIHKSEYGATATEVAVLLALLVLAALVAVASVGEEIADQQCLVGGAISEVHRPLHFNATKNCCGYNTSEFGGKAFHCVD